MKIARFIIALLLLAFISGCIVEKEPPDDQGRETVVSMDQAITEYLENVLSRPLGGDKAFAAYDLFGVSDNGDEKIIYMWALIRKYGIDIRYVDFVRQGGSSGPVALILKEENGSYKVAGHREPGDGSNWWPDVKEIFPVEYHERILNYNSTKYKEMVQKINEKASNYINSEGFKARKHPSHSYMPDYGVSWKYNDALTGKTVTVEMN